MDIPKKFQQRFGHRVTHIVEELSSATPLVDLFSRLYDEQGSFASNFLQLEGIKESHIRLFLRKEKRSLLHSDDNYATFKDCLLESVRIASKADHRLVGTQHLLYSVFLLGLGDKKIKEFFSHIRRSPRRLKTILEGIVFSDIMMGIHPGWEDGHFAHQYQGEAHHAPHHERHSASALKGLGIFFHDLLESARQGSLDPLVGRAKELERIIQILNRRTKRNPMLVGDPGVGKTAIVHGLAQKIVQGDVPPSLREKSIFSLNLSSLVAGTMFRGDFEARLEAVLKEIRGVGGILFIDEIHNIVGAGSAMGTMDAANILKPALSQGEIQVIGSTTLDEYKLYIENDKALERRFQPIFINEPPLDESIQILHGLKERYEAFHGIVIDPEAIELSVRLSSRYIKDRFLPDKALDVLDEASAFVSITKGERNEEKQFEVLRRKALLLRRQKEEKLHQRLYDTAFTLKKQEEAVLKKALFLEEQSRSEKRPAILTQKDVKHAITIMTGIPIEELTIAENKWLEGLEKDLSASVVGQKEAISLLANSVRRARAGLNARNRPLGSFIFIGPSGVGKTELARVLARRMFGQGSFIKLDMSEFSEPHNISRLIGAPAGYVGYGKGGELTEKVRRNPHSIVLFDEIEKAHPQLFNILLQILEDGRLTDASGLEVDFKNTIIILTSNLGTEMFYDSRAAIGFAQAGEDEGFAYDAIKKESMRALSAHMRPEFLNRIDEIIVFHPLTPKDIKAIALLRIQQLVAQLKEEKGITLKYGTPLISWLAKRAFSAKQGARLVQRTIEREVNDLLAKHIISGKLSSRKLITASLVQDQISFK